MPDVPVTPAGNAGFIPDRPDHHLPPTAWTKAENVRFDDGVAFKARGYDETNIPVTGVPDWLMSFRSRDRYYLLYIAGTNVRVHSKTGDSDITPTGDNALSIGGKWNGDTIGGIPIITNGFDVPYSWRPGATGEELQPLNEWPEDYAAFNIRTFGNYVLALGVIKQNQYVPQMVKWSHPAEPGLVPQSWDHTDLTTLAGENTLLESPGELVDGGNLRGDFILYKEDSVYLMREVGGQFIFNFDRLFSDVGLLAKGCFADLGNQHVFISTDDIKVHDGSQVQSLLDGRLRRWFFDTMNKDHYDKCFVFNYPEQQEVWFCMPVNSVYPDTALVWNRRDNTFSTRSLPRVRMIERGVEHDPMPAWQTLSQSWTQLNYTWGLAGYRSTALVPIAVAEPSDGVGRMFRMDQGWTANGETECSLLERKSLALVGKDSDGNPIVNTTQHKLAVEIWPEFEILQGTPNFQAYVGSQDKLGADVQWSGPFSFDPAAQEKINCLVGGKILAIRFESNDDSGWVFHGYQISIRGGGRYGSSV